MDTLHSPKTRSYMAYIEVYNRAYILTTLGGANGERTDTTGRTDRGGWDRTDI